MVDVEKAVIARYKSGGNVFEILVDCDNALRLRDGQSVSLADILATDKVFSDARKGLTASSQEIEAVFETTDPDEVAKKIIAKGEIQVTAEHRAKLRERKRKKILDIIHRNGMDPRTKAPHPLQRIELAFEEAKIRIDDHRKAEEQVEIILKQLRPILPISFEKLQVEVRIPSVYAGKAYSVVSAFGKLVKDQWMNDGSWYCIIEIPAGIQGDLYDSVNKLTQGEADTKILK